MTQGTKRGSPGAEEEKSFFEGVEIGDEEAKQLEDIQREAHRINLAIERESYKKLHPSFEKRRPILKAIQKFWPVALMRHVMLSSLLTHTADQSALTYLEDLWVERDPEEPRAFTLQFFFRENPYFSNKQLEKEYKHVPPPASADDKPDENGITDSMIDFSWKEQTTTIDWKSDDKNLTKLYPREVDPEDETDVIEPGSFFNFFEHEGGMEVANAIADEVFPDAVEYFLGNLGGEELDSEDEDEDDEDDAEEIDLEKPRPKRRRT